MSEWHVTAEVWQAYAAGRLDEIAVMSIDTHVAHCAACREGARAMVPATQTDAVWAGIVHEVRRPALPPTVRWLRRLGVPEEDVVVLGASEGFVLPWALAVGSALLCALLTAMISVRQDEIFWVLAPIAPVFAVIAAFETTDRLRAIMGSTPYDKVHLAVLRAVATLAVAIPATVGVGFAVPGLSDLAFVWLLPSLALTSAALVLHTWISSWTAATLSAGVWLAVVATAARTDDFSALSASGVQLACLGLTVTMAAVFVLRSSSFRLLGGEG